MWHENSKDLGWQPRQYQIRTCMIQKSCLIFKSFWYRKPSRLWNGALWVSMRGFILVKNMWGLFSASRSLESRWKSPRNHSGFAPLFRKLRKMHVQTHQKIMSCLAFTMLVWWIWRNSWEFLMFEASNKLFCPFYYHSFILTWTRTWSFNSIPFKSWSLGPKSFKTCMTWCDMMWLCLELRMVYIPFKFWYL